MITFSPYSLASVAVSTGGAAAEVDDPGFIFAICAATCASVPAVMGAPLSPINRLAASPPFTATAPTGCRRGASPGTYAGRPAKLPNPGRKTAYDRARPRARADYPRG